MCSALACAMNVQAQSALSADVCRSFLTEAQKLVSLGANQKGHSSYSRLQRLEERLRLFCPDFNFELKTVNAPKKTVKSDNKPLLQVAATDLKQSDEQYQDADKQSAWLQFYKASERCSKARKTTQEHVYCSEEIAQQKRDFEQQWQQQSTAQVSSSSANIGQNLQASEQVKTHVPNAVQVESKQPEPQLRNTHQYEQYAQSQQQTSIWLHVGRYVWFILLIASILVVTGTVWPYTRRILHHQISRILLSSFLAKSLPKSDYNLVGKIHFLADGKMHHIDELVISKYGIFIVQYQNQGGAIWEDAHSDLWTQSIDDERNYFDNPLTEVAQKIKWLKGLLDIEAHVEGCIVFPNDVFFRTPMAQKVCLYKNAPSYIQQFDVTVFEPQQLDMLKEQIKLYQKDMSFTQRITQLVTQGP
ncbi:nuclease-related domain-containing protein [Pseudoalteromonas sp. S16_S37]|uniref:nuclease-related domain-containing protein n=1 Tax=Pseudoalteromonas sp. S16_S37 TaxID=2720228 RepID=UPI001680394B|nr:nuclease-related domain-containing protein [Pseudoalteromonas sp. S16_S37]MBD1583756.1 NERD domain-containing protein [Pseudoalteromonas sp. S16_S37]